ncbi:hypothetical protein, partial [Pedobacter sp.]
MRTLFTLLICLNLTNAFSQIKVFSDGRVSIGSTVAPYTGVNLQLKGNNVFTSTPTGSTSSAYIRGLNAHSTASNPDYTWWNNDNTGIFHPSFSNIGFSINGTEKMRLDENGDCRIGSSFSAGKLTIAAAQNQNGLSIYTNHSNNYNYAQIINVTNVNTKSIVVKYNGSEV